MKADREGLQNLMSPSFKMTDKIIFRKNEKLCTQGKNNPKFTDIEMGLELTTGLRNTILDGKIFHAISHLVLICIQKQTECEKPRKEIKQNTRTTLYCCLYPL